MPSLRGMAPTKMATSISLKASAASAVGITSEEENYSYYVARQIMDYRMKGHLSVVSAE